MVFGENPTYFVVIPLKIGDEVETEREDKE